MSLLDRYGENVARTVDRRKFLKRTASVVFSITTAAAISLDRSLTAQAASCPVGGGTSGSCNCSPPGVGYCILHGKHCNGYKCGSGCSTYTGYYSSGCWCTDTCYNGELTYFVCCDCNCGGTLCGCEQEYWV